MAVSTTSGELIQEPRGWGRRMVTTPVLFLFGLGSLVLLPLMLAIALIVDGIRRTRYSACRTVLFFTFFIWIEIAGLTLLFVLWLRRLAGLDAESYEEANRRVQIWWVRSNFAAVTRLFSVQVEVEGRSALDDERPCVVLSQHASTLDPLIPMGVSESMKRFRYVMKAELLLDPALDYCGQRLPNAFVRRGSDDPVGEVQKVVDLGRGLSRDDALVLYPEGTRFTPSKRRRLLEKYADDPEMRAVVESLKATLPPLREGVLKLLQTTPRADVVFIAHRGLHRAGSMADLLGGGLTRALFEVRIWRIPAHEIARDPQGLRHFLLANWKEVDRFSDRSHSPE